MKTTIAVIVPYRGDLNHLQEAINSIRESTFKDFRILVLDDNDQPHGGLDFLQDGEYFPTGGIGLPAVIEFSKNLISEDFVAILAGDDIMSSSRLQLQLEAIRKVDSEICLSRMQKFSISHEKLGMLSGNPKIEIFTKAWLLLGAYGADGTILMTTAFYKNKYVLDPIDSYSDWALALANYPSSIAYVPQDLVFYRQHEGQTTRKGRNDFLSSSVYQAWSDFFLETFDCSPPIEIFLILAAPWFRTKISPKSILDSRVHAQQILNLFRDKRFSVSDQKSVEMAVLRRYLFRMNFTNFLPVLFLVNTIGINKPIRKLWIEAFKISNEFLTQREIRPRIVSK